MTSDERKQYPLYRGLFRYFPDALMEVAHVSYVANEQHNPGEPIHWAKEKSTDEADALLRHLLEAGTRDTDGLRHTGKVAWRALALLQRELEAERGAGEQAITAVATTQTAGKPTGAHSQAGALGAQSGAAAASRGGAASAGAEPRIGGFVA